MRCVLRELAEAIVMTLSGMLGCGCVPSRRGELRRIVNDLRAYSRCVVVYSETCVSRSVDVMGVR